jgi:hypothetical protein
MSGAFFEVSDGTRTRDRLDHNQELYQLSYAHQARANLAAAGGRGGASGAPSALALLAAREPLGAQDLIEPFPREEPLREHELVDPAPR